MDRYSFFEHDADVGVIGHGPRLEDAFCDAARAVFSLSTDLEAVRPTERIAIEFDESDPELALVAWLNLLLGHAHDRGLALGRFGLEVSDGHWRGEAWGEPWRRDLPRGIDVKGATLTMLGVERENGAWVARCVVDV